MSEISAKYEDLRHCIVKDRWFDNTVVIHCRGVLDMLTAPVLKNYLARICGKDPAAIIIDLTEVEFLASHGMGVLIDAHDMVSPRIAFSVVADGPVTRRPLELVGMHALMPLHRTLDAALESAVADPPHSAVVQNRPLRSKISA